MQLFNIKYLVFSSLIFFVGCKAGGEYPGIEYMPDMKHSRAYESFTDNPIFKDGKTNQLPVKGTISRGFKPYHLQNSTEDYERAGRELLSPYNTAEHKAVLDEGKALYSTYCVVCHGKEGNAQGQLIVNGKYPPPPTYFRDDILYLTEGKMFHSITHGKNLMGSYASQLNQEERWKVIAYIKDMQAKHIAKAEGIEYDPALAKTFTGAGYMSESQYERKLAMANKKDKVDREYADVMSDAHYGFGNGLQTGGDAHGHGGGHGKGHGDGHGKGHGDDHGKGHAKDHGQGKAHVDVKDKSQDLAKDPVEDKSNDIVEETKTVVADAADKMTKALGFGASSSISRGARFELKNVKFRPGSSRLQAASNAELDQLFEVLQKNPNSSIEIGGHTDNTGAAEMNNALSTERARRVMDYLSGKGVAPARMSAKGYGSSVPVASNESDQGRAENRRTEVTFK